MKSEQFLLHKDIIYVFLWLLAVYFVIHLVEIGEIFEEETRVTYTVRKFGVLEAFGVKEAI